MPSPSGSTGTPSWPSRTPSCSVWATTPNEGNVTVSESARTSVGRAATMAAAPRTLVASLRNNLIRGGAIACGRRHELAGDFEWRRFGGTAGDRGPCLGKHDRARLVGLPARTWRRRDDP